MTRRILPLLLALAFASPARAAKLNVIATFPELVDMAQRIGGDHVSVEGLARGPEDPHQVVMKPSFVTKLNRADAVIFLGLSLEHTFLPGLLEVAVNPKIKSDPVRDCSGPGCIECSKDIPILDKPQSLSRAEGELHAQGNPHYNIGPQNGPQMARNIAAGLSRIDPDHAADYDKNLKAYLAELESKLVEWRKLVLPLKGMKAVSYHSDIAYLAKFTGLDFVGSVEVKPGIPPTPTHLAALTRDMKQQNVRLIVREQHFEGKTVEWLAGQTGAKVAVIGVIANSLPDTKTWVGLMDKNLKAVVDAAGRGGS